MTDSAEYSLTGSIEQDADCVLLLHRPENGTDIAPGAFQELDILIAKNCSGSTGRVRLEWNGDTGCMRDERASWRSWCA